ncbi:MAG: GAF domain-containing protein, partial [Pseudomonadota bacterium]
MTQSDNLLHRLEELNAIGVALSSERDINRLLETILVAAKRITNADAGTLYLLEPDQQLLRFEIMRTDSLGIEMGGTTGKHIPFYPIHLTGKDGKPNDSMVVAHVALNDTTVNLADAYSAEGFDFSGTKNFDKKTGYRSTSFLAVPMKNHENEIIGVLQLINSQDPANREVVAFSDADQRLAESLASQAAIALTNRQLINQLEVLFESFIAMINTAIDEKSPYTGGHCQRVPELTMMLAEAVNETREGALKDFDMSDKDRYELKIAGLLHDCGKVTTPVHVVDKATKLELIYDRIHLIDTRFEVLKRDAEIEMLKNMADLRQRALDELSLRQGINQLELDFKAHLRRLDQDREFLRKCNIGGEFMSAEAQEQVRKIAKYKWLDQSGHSANFLTDDETLNLCIPRGTLTDKEREIINYHIVATIKMLEALPWPK